MKSVDHLLALVKLDSLSGHEQKVRTYITKYIKYIGFETRVDDTGNLYGFGRLTVSSPLLLCAHMDTVEPGHGIKPYIRQGVVKSNGTTILGADNKAAIAAILAALAHYKKKYQKFPPIELLFTVKEETGGGVDYIQRDWLHSTNAVIFDYAKPLGKIVSNSPYITNFEVEFMGKAAHASEPEQGKNALLSLTDFVTHMSIGRIDGGKTLLNIGVVQGGSGNNTIPALVQCTGEVRSLSKTLFSRQLKKIQRLAHAAAKRYGCKTQITTSGYCTGYRHKIGSINPGLLQSFAAEGYTATCEPTFSVSDANILNSMGITTVVLSDGVEKPHTVHEQISVKTLYSLEKLVYRIVYNWACL